MYSYHLHIKGQVQGVGFRPYIYHRAIELDLKGWVNNGLDGVHVVFNTELDPGYVSGELLDKVPERAVVEDYHLATMDYHNYPDFRIIKSESSGSREVRLSPDFGLCKPCKEEMDQEGDRRFQYAFTTCTQCGPRYSIINNLPYDRQNTSMECFIMCPECYQEYDDVGDRRFYSQSNSCPNCSIILQLYFKGKITHCKEQECLDRVMTGLSAGKTVAVKGIGGYLLLCDASDEIAIHRLRQHKRRPEKPLAMLYPNIDLVTEDYQITLRDEELLEGATSPVVLLHKKERPASKVHWEGIAPGLDRYGVMLPYAPLLYLISKRFKKPLVATSGNLSGSPIVYEDQVAQDSLSHFADYILTHNRSILIPQDDSVLYVPSVGPSVAILRRSRGFAPSYFGRFPKEIPEGWLGLGAQMKGAFALSHNRQIFVSQYLGHLDSFDAQLEYEHVLEHLGGLLGFTPRTIFTDTHPQYFVHRLAQRFKHQELPVHHVQHHKAHFGAVLMENELQYTDEPVLGIIWDGTGYGDDGNIWGGEFFRYQKNEIDRICHLEEYPHIMGNKMSKEPRLSALSLARHIGVFDSIVERAFSSDELQVLVSSIYQQNGLKTSSMGRLFDAVASLLGLIDKSTFEGQAAMYLEAKARSFKGNVEPYPIEVTNGKIGLNGLVGGILYDLERCVQSNKIAFKFHWTLIHMIRTVAEKYNIWHLAFSGGVFQNSLLVRLIVNELGKDYKVYFHQELSCNDENIAFGQLACGYLEKRKEMMALELKDTI